MKFHFRDINADMVEAWNKWFSDLEDVTVSQGDIFGAGPHDAIVSPSNSFGFLDGGIDLVYSNKFGWGVQKTLQKKLKDEHDSELPVGQAVIVPTEDKDFPLLVSAPTMRIPMRVGGTVNSYLAFRATIRAIIDWNKTEEKKIETVLCPGLGTAIGQMPYSACAKQMFCAYMSNHKKQPKEMEYLGQATNFHYDLLM